MTELRYDVLGVGNAIVDVLASCDDAFIAEHGLEKDAMLLIDEARAESLYAAMPPAVEISGGSAANTMAGIASLGGQGAFFGKVADDQLGEVFTHDMRAAGVDFDTAALSGGPATARSLILVPPDARRAMNTFLGASTLFSEADIDPARVAAAAITYLEGYLFDREEAKAAFVRAAEIAQAADRRVALTLSDKFCVDRHRASFRQLVRNHVDILFANEAELTALYETGFDDALAQVAAETRLAAVTRSEKGAVVAAGGELFAVPAEPVTEIVDTTGAGDMFAAGFLYAHARDRAPADCARLGAIAAAECITHVGARPETNLGELAGERGFALAG